MAAVCVCSCTTTERRSSNNDNAPSKQQSTTDTTTTTRAAAAAATAGWQTEKPPKKFGRGRSECPPVARPLTQQTSTELSSAKMQITSRSLSIEIEWRPAAPAQAPGKRENGLSMYFRPLTANISITQQGDGIQWLIEFNITRKR